MLFTRKKVVDERVVNMQNKIYREINYLVLIICILSIAIKFSTKGFDPDYVQTECAILLAIGLYYTYRSAKLGLFSSEIEMHDANSKYNYNTTTIFWGIALGVLIAILMGVNSAYNYADSTQQAINYFFVVFGVTLLMYAPVFIIIALLSVKSMKKASDNVNKKLLEEDNSGE